MGANDSARRKNLATNNNVDKKDLITRSRTNVTPHKDPSRGKRN